MQRALMTGLATTALLVAGTPALARQGCGAGFHRGAAGGCRPNARPGYAPPVLVVGRFYPGRGYWYGGRYWANRYRWHRGWRYR